MIQEYLNAGFPALYLLTNEPHRVIEKVITNTHNFFSWDCIQGIMQGDVPVDNQIVDPLDAIKWITSQQDNTVLIANNLHLFIEGPDIIQAIQNAVQVLKSRGSSICIVAPVVKLPPELDKYFHLIEIALPTSSELFDLQEALIDGITMSDENLKIIAPHTNKSVADVARGLTLFEAETAYALSLVKTSTFDKKVVSEAKAQMIKKSGFMEFWEPEPESSLGGLQNFKDFINNRKRTFESDSTLPPLKGIIMLGPPGTGKSLSAKVVASILQIPLIRLDISALKGSLVGQSEEQIRRATAIIDAFGDSVLWLDELEKAFAGTQSSGQTDGGTSAAMFGHFLNWMQEKKGKTLVMATANNIALLPPELLRAGRFDAIFFVDLPTSEERRQIIDIMLRRYYKNEEYEAEVASRDIEQLVTDTNGFTGAEIEQLIKDALFDGIDVALTNIVPLSQTMKEDIISLRSWAQSRARFANTKELKEPYAKVRRINM